jgi:hypothetical protein
MSTSLCLHKSRPPIFSLSRTISTLVTNEVWFVPQSHIGPNDPVELSVQTPMFHHPTKSGHIHLRGSECPGFPKAITRQVLY